MCGKVITRAGSVVTMAQAEFTTAVYQLTEDSQSPAGSTESETLDEIMRRLLPTPTLSHPKAAPIPSDRELLIQRLLGVIRSPQPVVQERSQLTDMEIALQKLRFGRG